MAQSIRCYTPMDFQLLLEGTGLALCSMEVHGVDVNLGDNKAATQAAFREAESYLAVLTRLPTVVSPATR